MKKNTGNIGISWEHFWFRPISAAGFGMMRMGYGAITLMYALMEWPLLGRFYGPEGILPREQIHVLVRDSWRFSLIDGGNMARVECLYLAFVISLLLVTIGIATRRALLASVILLFSFHEYGGMWLDGSDTLTRVIGFLLVLSPCDRTFTLTNALRRFRLSEETGIDQDPAERMMPIWPYRLLLWQMTLLYAVTAIDKSYGKSWQTGSAVAIVLHHHYFSRFSLSVADQLSILSPFLTYLSLLLEASWILILPLGFLSLLTLMKRGAFDGYKRFVLIGGVLLHGGIFFFLDVFSFSFVIFTSYLGLLIDNDFRAIRSFINHGMRRPLIVLYDGRCGYCKKAMMLIRMTDWLHRVTLENLHDPEARASYAPKISIETLNESMHAVDENNDITKGFYAVRAICRELPVLWPVVFLLSVPGVPFIGERIYGSIAAHRPIVAK